MDNRIDGPNGEINLDTLADQINKLGYNVSATVDSIVKWYLESQYRENSKPVKLYQGSGIVTVDDIRVDAKTYNRQLDINYVVNLASEVEIHTRKTDYIPVDDCEYW